MKYSTNTVFNFSLIFVAMVFRPAKWMSINDLESKAVLHRSAFIHV